MKKKREHIYTGKLEISRLLVTSTLHIYELPFADISVGKINTGYFFELTTVVVDLPAILQQRLHGSKSFHISYSIGQEINYKGSLQSVSL